MRAILVLMVLAVATSDPAGALTRDRLACPVREEWSGDSQECPCQEDWKPTLKQLDVTRETQHYRDPTVPAQPILCNADLSGADLQGANLMGANLEGANFGGADLQKGWLSGANLERATFWRTNLREANFGDTNLRAAHFGGAHLQLADLTGADLQEANLMSAHLRAANLRHANLRRAGLKKADLTMADLTMADLGKADLSVANLQRATFRWANLQEAQLSYADLQGANLTLANVQKADLTHADLQGADLSVADLQGANLRNANLQRADLSGANLENASLAFGNLGGAIYAPASRPPDDYLEGLRGLSTVTSPPGRQSGLVQLRTLLQMSGLRDLEREATYAIERNKARHARRSDNPLFVRLGAWLQIVFFEWTTGYGLYPSRAILMLLGLMMILSIVYTVPVAASPAHTSNQHGIFRVWPVDRIDTSPRGASIARSVQVERLTASVPAAVAWAFYFSLLSAFHIGWRDLNVGTWLTRMQPTEFALRGRGWVRCVSGLQSLISVYLVAIWALTYFARPFD